MKVRPLIERLFAVPEKERRWWEIILWWELRRFPYNAIVGAFGLFWLVAFAVVNELPPQLPFEERDWEPLSVVIFAIAVNVFYTEGGRLS